MKNLLWKGGASIFLELQNVEIIRFLVLGNNTSSETRLEPPTYRLEVQCAHH